MLQKKNHPPVVLSTFAKKKVQVDLDNLLPLVGAQKAPKFQLANLNRTGVEDISSCTLLSTTWVNCLRHQTHGSICCHAHGEISCIRQIPFTKSQQDAVHLWASDALVRFFDGDLCCHLRLIVFFWKTVFEGFVCDGPAPIPSSVWVLSSLGPHPILAPANHNNMV